MTQFFFGASLSAHQVEGGNRHSDWWNFEKEVLQAKGIECSGHGTKHWDMYETDFKLAAQLGHNAHRLSLEWAKIEPVEGKINYEAIEHYKKVFRNLRHRKLKPFVTLWHFTLPQWFANKGGFTKKSNVRHFVNFCKFVGTEFRDDMEYVITINEPNIYAYNSYLVGDWPPQKKGIRPHSKVLKNLVLAHKMAYSALKNIKPEFHIGISKNNQVLRPDRKKNPLDIAFMKFIDYTWNYQFLNRIRKHMDFIGLNYYFYHCVRADFKLADHFMQYSYPTSRRTDMNWEVYPKGIYTTTQALHKKYKMPIIITENGVADKHDKLRTDAIKESLYWLFKSKDKGANIFGYLHWALTDNFEWAWGYKPRFGLIEINYDNYNRTIRPSALVYKDLIQEYLNKMND